MIDVVKDKNKKIVAYCEWSLRDKFGLEDKEGKFIYIHDIWVHKKFRNNGMIRKFIDMIEPKVPTAREVYWKRSKYKERPSQYGEKQILKLKEV